MRIHWIGHVPFEGPGALATLARRRGHTLSATRVYAGEVLPRPARFDLLVIMGGPMGVAQLHDHPHLADEMALIRAARSAGRGVLGICLGGQLIAAACGGTVTRNREPEIGWWPVTRTADAARSPFGSALPARVTTFHWHADTFTPPPGALTLARSAGCARQAFALDARTLGVQFHPESTPGTVAALCEAFPGPHGSGPFVHDSPAMRAGLVHAPAGHAVLAGWLDHFAAVCAGSGRASLC